MRQSSTDLRTRILGFLGGIVLKVLYWTLRKEAVGVKTLKNFWEDEVKLIVLWHEHQIALTWTHCGKRELRFLISEHRDGRLIAEGIRYHGIGSIAGSSTRGGARALVEMISTLRQGIDVGITPDGPKGPRHVVKQGVIAAAKKAGVPLYPLGAGCSNGWRARSWDRMLVPKPFSRVVMAVGDPILVPKDATPEQEEQCRLKLEEELKKVVARAQAIVGEDPC